MTETRNRLKVLLWAYAYEIKNEHMVSDAEFDRVCKEIDLTKTTDRPDMDEWFIQNFDPSTGIWVHSLPDAEKKKLAYKYESMMNDL